MNNITTITNCPITNSTDRFTYLDLGEMPLVNNLCDTKEQSLNCKKYPLAVQYFTKSKLSCLTETINPMLMFSEYSYKSGISKAYIEHCKDILFWCDSYLFLKEEDLILDIGGNDGTLLKTFLKKKPYLNVLNIDASKNLAKLSEQSGIPTYNGFWGVETAKKIDKKFKLITSTNVFQHTPPIADYVEAISMSLSERGIWCLEFPYWRRTMETKQYDQIYHEHVYFYLVEPLRELFDKFGLKIIKATEIPIHGGSIRLLISPKSSSRQICYGVDYIINEEQLITEDNYKNWNNQVKSHMDDCNSYIITLKETGANIVGFGAAAKGCVFLNSLKLDYTILDCVIDDTDLKKDKYIPGTGIQIHNRDYLKNNNVDYILILAHNFKDSIIESLTADGYIGQFIVLFPEIQTI